MVFLVSCHRFPAKSTSYDFPATLEYFLCKIFPEFEFLRADPDVTQILTTVGKCNSDVIANLAVSCQVAQKTSNGCTQDCVDFIDALSKSSDANCQAVYKELSPALAFFSLCDGVAPDAAPGPLQVTDDAGITGLLAKFPAQCNSVILNNQDSATTCVNALTSDHGGTLNYCPETCSTVFKAFTTDSSCEQALIAFIDSDGIGDIDINNGLDYCATSLGISNASLALKNSGLVAKLPAKCTDVINKNGNAVVECSKSLDGSPSLKTCPGACTTAFKAITSDPGCSDAIAKLVSSHILDDYGDQSTTTAGILEHNVKVCAGDLVGTPSTPPSGPSPGSSPSSTPSTSPAAPASSAVKALTSMAAGMAALLAL